VHEREAEDLSRVVPLLLATLEALGFIARRLHPPDFDQVLSAVGEVEAELGVARAALSDWRPELADMKASLEAACDHALAAFEGLRDAQGGMGDLRQVFRALGHVPRAQEALYPFAAGLGPVSRYFTAPDRRDDADLQARLMAGAGREGVGVMHVDNEPGSRGGFSLYVPETYDGEAAPLVVALHGGAGNGRSFLWTWLRDARARGAILVTPTAVGDTWALMGPDPDTPNLERIVQMVRGRWSVDPARLLLTGMSDGGTFAYVSGLEAGSVFTHLAPISAAFHPMLAQFADAERLQGLPIHIVHGTLDWMFPAAGAREAAALLAGAGAAVTFREVEDLSHTYPRELNGPILDWLEATARPAVAAQPDAP
jgi:phospholipase/carboxylesterase